MTVNHGGNLTKEYFLAYISLVMNAHNCSLNQARDYMIDHFFKGNPRTFGKYTYSNFAEAVKEFPHIKKEHSL